MPKGNIFSQIMAVLRSPRGRNIAMFFLFTAVSSALWMVLAMNDEQQYDARLPLEVTHVPDSITLINTPPKSIAMSVRAKGTQLIKLYLGGAPTVDVDFRAYRTGEMIRLNASDLKSLVRQATDGLQASSVYPDSLALTYTSHPGFRLPIYADYHVSTSPRKVLAGRPRLSADSVMIFLPSGVDLPDSYTEVRTQPVRIIGLDSTTTRRVRLIGPKGTRVIPDSVDITFRLEPMIFKSRKVVIEPQNVPAGTRLITFPAQADVHYMVPKSAYGRTSARFRVVADYHSINPRTGKVKLNITNVSDGLHNVYLSTDSAEYIIEQHK